MPIAISVNMLRLRVRIDWSARTMNGQPAHSTTGVAKHELDPVRPRLADELQAEQVLAHLQHEHRNGQRQRDPEPPRHVGEFGIGAAVGGHHVRLERHAADRAAPRPDLAHLRMHRTGVDRAFRHRLRRGLAAEDISPDRRRTWSGSRREQKKYGLP